MVVSRAHSPGHVTGFFSIHSHEDPRQSGSIGAGFNVSQGVTTTLERAEVSQLFLNGEKLDGSSVSMKLLNAFQRRTGDQTPWLVRHETALPVGCGFGTSGAGALSLALALNSALNNPLEPWEAGELAHRAELEAGTGLGTVLAEFAGGFEVRTQAGAPGTGTVQNLEFSDSLRAAFLVFGPMATPRVLSDPTLRQILGREGETMQKTLLADPRPQTFLELSYQFGRQTGLVSEPLVKLQDTLSAQGIVAPMLMFGNGLFTLVESSILNSILKTFEQSAPDARVLFGAALDRQGGRSVVSD